MALYLGEAHLKTLFERGAVSPLDCIETVAASFREHGQGQAGVLPRQILWEDPRNALPRARALKLSAAYMRASRVMGASLYPTHFTPGGLDMWLTVFSGETGRMLGVINSNLLSVIKTAATAAVAARALARPGSRRLALVGTGRYAFSQLEYLAAALPLEEAWCFSRSEPLLQAFCRDASARLGIPVRAATSVAEAVSRADIVTTITTSPTPVLLGEWLPAGVHCNIMGQHAPAAREVDTAAVLASRVVVDATEQAMQEKGELLLPIAENAMGPGHVAGELGAVLCGRLEGRQGASQNTMFCSGGTAFEYMGLCALLLDRAAQAGIGQRLEP